MAEKEYQRLPGRGFRREGNFVAAYYQRSSLWLGKDHVLVVDESWTEQTFRRFFFKDVQTLTVCKSGVFAFWIRFNLVVAALFGGGMLLTDNDIAQGFLVAVVGFFVLCLLIHLFKGPTCTVHVRTAVQAIELPSLSRMRAARKTLAILRPLIEAAQGSVDQEELPCLVKESFEARLKADGIDGPVPGVIRSVADKPVSKYSGRWHRWLFVLFLVDGLMSLSTLVVQSMAQVIVGSIFFIGLAIVNIMALVYQKDSAMQVGLRRLTGTALGYVILSFIAGWIQTVAFTISNPGTAGDQLAVFEHLANLDPFEHGWYLTLLLVFGVFSLVIGLLGLTWLNAFRKQLQVIAASRPIPPALPPQKVALPTDADPALNPQALREAQTAPSPSSEKTEPGPQSTDGSAHE